MHQSHVISLSIDCPADAVYAYLAEPANFPEWAVSVGPSFRQIGPLEWAGPSATGEKIVRFCARNALGVLDHAIYRAGDEPLMMPMRVFPNGDGCELTFIYFRRPGMTDEQFASTVEWVTTDFLALRSLLEASHSSAR